MRQKLGKKGMFEEQFNWMFVLVAGAVIIFFFFNFLVRQQALAQAKSEISINTELDSIASGVQNALNTAILVTIPKTKLALDCTLSCECKFGIQGSAVRRTFGDKFIFGPKVITGPQMLVWSKPWEVPYAVTNFVYVTTPSIRYTIGYVSGDTDSENMYHEFQRLWPGLIEYKPITLSYNTQYWKAYEEGTATEYQNEKFLSTRFVLFIPHPPPTAPPGAQVDFEPHSSFTARDFSALIVTGSSFENGSMSFFQLQPGPPPLIIKTEMDYAGTASLLAAVFSEDARAYYCTMSRAMSRLNTSLEVLANRSRMLSIDWGSRGSSYATCQALHGNVYRLISGKEINGNPTLEPAFRPGIQNLLPRPPYDGELVNTAHYARYNGNITPWLNRVTVFKKYNYELNLNSCVEVY
jgi:hypothetical protein